MAISIRELLGMSQASSGDYRHGLGWPSAAEQGAKGRHPRGALVPPGKAAHFPCMNCGKMRPTDKLPCPHCKQNKGWAKCGGLGATTVMGQEDLEPGDYGYQYVQTTKPNTTVMGKPQGRAPVGRRVNITQLVAEAEYLAGTPGVHPRVLAQKVWQARKALMGSSRWEWANYQNQGSAYDSYDDLVARLESVERVLGVDKVSPKIMSQLYGGLGNYQGYYRGPAWGENIDPVAKLASCIRGTLCQPKAFCCDQGTYYEDPFFDEEPWDEPWDVAAAAGAAGGGYGGGGAPPTLVEITDPRTQTDPRTDPRVSLPRVSLPPRTPPPPPPPPPPVKPPAIKIGEDVKLVQPKPKPAVSPAAQKAIKAGGFVQSWVPPKPTTTKPLVGGAGIPVGAQRGGMVRVGGGFAPGTAVALHGLGRRQGSPAMARLIDQLRQARRQVRR